MTDKRFKALASLLHHATLVCEIALPPILLATFFAIAMGMLPLPLPVNAAPTGIFLWTGIAVGLLPALALMWALDTLRRLFARYKIGDILTEPSARLIRQTGKALFLLAVLKFAVQPIQSLLLTWQSPPGSRAISLTVSQAEIGFLLAAGLLTVIGWAMTEAARAADENRSFV